MNSFYLLKALHIIFIVTWFSGLFYILRLFIYHTEAQEKEEVEKNILSKQFKIMERRLWYGITWPSSILTFFFGISLIKSYMPLSLHLWLKVKLIFVFFLYLYHFYCHYLYEKIQQNIFIFSSKILRVLNEVATIFLISIVSLVVLKDLNESLKFSIKFLLLITPFIISIYLYKRIRKQREF